MGLLLDGGAELEEVLGDGLVRSLEDVDQTARRTLDQERVRSFEGWKHLRSGVGLVLYGEKGDGLTSLPGTSSTSDTVNIVLDG